MPATLWGICALAIDDELIGLATQPILILAAITISEFKEHCLYMCFTYQVYRLHTSYKLLINVEDETDKSTFLVFSEVAEKLIGVSVAKLTLAGQGDRYVLPKPIGKKLIDRTTLFTIISMLKPFEADGPSFRAIACRIIDSPTSSDVIPSLPSTTEIEKTSDPVVGEITTDKPQPSSLSMTQIPQDLFPEESPVKKIKT
ncbi:hypothetical protein PTKIN_Ptkin16aG0073300 [Pterospermum kingtungense]